MSVQTLTPDRTWRDGRSPERRPATPVESFRFPYYQRLNQRRLEHLASLGLPLSNRSVLEVGAGVGDLTTFWLDRGCRVHSTDARPEHVEILAQTFAGDPRFSCDVLDLDAPPRRWGDRFDIVFCYGLLYHLREPKSAIGFMADACAGLLLLETCVSRGGGESLNPVAEDSAVYSQAVSGTGCRPTRTWVRSRLRERFQHVVLPVSQPAHEEFPLDWTAPGPADLLTRAVFIASREPIPGGLFVTELPHHQSLDR